MMLDVFIYHSQATSLGPGRLDPNLKVQFAVIEGSQGMTGGWIKCRKLVRA